MSDERADGLTAVEVESGTAHEAEGFRGFVTVRAIGVDAVMSGQLDPAALRAMAMQFIAAAEAAEQDAIVFAMLTEDLELPEKHAAKFVANMRERRNAGTTPPIPPADPEPVAGIVPTDPQLLNELAEELERLMGVRVDTDPNGAARGPWLPFTVRYGAAQAAVNVVNAYVEADKADAAADVADALDAGRSARRAGLVDWSLEAENSCPTCGRELGESGGMVVCDNCSYSREPIGRHGDA